ncbi:MAG: DUF1905 domain-containing protein [Gemmatimonadota bacterium]|nr:MAG: DUF1905 domain-containing protein [Gemmatimonadota bacterium]
MASSGEEHRFSAEIYKVGVNRCVDVPERVAKAFGSRRYVPVLATVRGHSVRTNLVPGGGGRYRLFLDGEIRRAARADTGDRVSVTLKFDRGPREVSVPEDVAKALRRAKGARAAFDELTLNQRREFLRYVLKAKKPETRARRVEQGIPLLLEMAARKGSKRRTP